MDSRKYQAGASATPPTVPASPSTGYPTNGNPGTGTPATQPGEFWFYQIGEELRNAIVTAGLTPVTSDLTQLYQAILAISGALATAVQAQGLTNNTTRLSPLRLNDAFQGANQTLSANGYQKLPGGLIIQWGGATYTAGTPVSFPIAFPTNIFTFAVSSDQSQTANVEVVGYQALSLTQFTPAGAQFSGSTFIALNPKFNWIAIGN